MSRLVALVCCCAALLPGCRNTNDAPHVVVGAGTSDEQQVLAAVTARVLADAGFEVSVRGDLGDTRGLRRAALAGDIDVYWDYTGAAWALGMNQQAPTADPVESFERVKRADEQRGLAWLEPSNANATLALFVRNSQLPAERGRRGLAWLAGELSRGNRSLCADAEFIRRPGGLDSLADAYAMDLRRVTAAAIEAPEASALRRAATGECFAALATATSGAARNLDLAPVTDDLSVFPAFIVAPVARQVRVEQMPALAEVMGRVAQSLDTDTLSGLNAAVAAGAAPEQVAEQFEVDRGE